MAARALLALGVCVVHARADGAYRRVSLSPNVTLNVLFRGAPASTASSTVLFLHGFPEGSWAWNAVMLEVEKAHPHLQLVAPDQRGYNMSSKPQGVSGYQVSALIEDAVALIEAVASGAVHLVAHDWGGAVAWALAQQHCDKLLSLTMVNMAHPKGWTAAIRAGGLQAARSSYVLRFVNPLATMRMLADDFAALRHIFAAEAWFKAADRDAFLRSWEIPGSVDGGLNWYRANIHPHCPLSCVDATCWRQGLSSTFDTLFPETPTVCAPTAVVWGLQDFAFDSKGALEYMQRNVTFTAGVRIATYQEYGHWIANEAPSLVAAEVLRVINERAVMRMHARGLYGARAVMSAY